MIYLDNNATTKVAPEVEERMRLFFGAFYGNPSSLYDFGKGIRRTIEEARAEVARFLGARSEREIIFTSGGTESNHTAIHSALKAHPERRRIVTSQVEHSSIRNLSRSLEREGYEVVSIGVSKQGTLDWEAFENALTDQVAVVSMMWANNETGVLFPVDRIGRFVKEKGILFHVDGVQAVGKLQMNLSSIPIDFLSFSAHKLHGPKGIGGLYVREGIPFFPLFVGGRQERDRRAGTENVPGIVGLAFALGLAVGRFSENEKWIRSLRNRLEDRLLREIPESFVNGYGEARISNTTNITIARVEAETLLIRLSEAGVAASSGSACLTGALEPSHVLEAMGLPRELAFGSLRFSLSRYTTSEEIDMTIQTVSKLVRELRELNKSSLRGTSQAMPKQSETSEIASLARPPQILAGKFARNDGKRL
ncbi:MAG: aminotransferase class V-fold PLP-dependent enzyme [Candidatus Omnitrophica bacterium]|nr:aminotransferase class V-fold PLP-dependent enzyme [Candidatus Omnitrophota bacterium]